MIVDDDTEDLETMRALLEKEGHEVVSCTDGAQALDNLTEDGFDLILIDIQMPTLTGYDLLRLAREKVNHGVKMIYVTIVPEKEVRMEDTDGFIQKPFSPEGFMEIVNKNLRK